MFQNNLRDKIDVTYNTSLPVIFGVKKYADALWGVCKSRDIKVNTQRSLVEIRGDKKVAIFQNLQNPEEMIVEKVRTRRIKFEFIVEPWVLLQYSFLHVCPPMGPPEILKRHGVLTNEAGFLCVDSKTLRHTRYDNVYGIGDCTTTPNSKTMAAIGKTSP